MGAPLGLAQIRMLVALVAEQVASLIVGILDGDSDWLLNMRVYVGATACDHARLVETLDDLCVQKKTDDWPRLR